MLVSVKAKKKKKTKTKPKTKQKHLDLDQVERDFCSARQAYAHEQQEEITEETSIPIPKKYLEYEVSQWVVVRGSTLTETALPGQAP